MKNNIKCPVGTQIQTLLFSKDNFTEKSAKSWAEHNNFKFGKVDIKENTLRLRQHNPFEYKRDSFRTIELTDGVKAVIGCPIEKKSITKPKYVRGGKVEFGKVLKVKDIENINQGDILGFIYKEEGKTTYTDFGKVRFYDENDKWGGFDIDGFPFEFDRKLSDEEKNNPEFELKEIENSGTYWSLYKINNEKMANGGNVKFYTKENEHRLGRPSGSIEKEILEKVKDRISSESFVGSFGWKTPKGKLGDGYLYRLDEFDQNLIKDLRLKQEERVFRYVNRTTAIGGMMLFIKINIDKGLLYFLTESDNDDIVFETKGVKALWVNLIEDKFDNGGQIYNGWEKQPEWHGNPSLGLDSYKKIFKHNTHNIPVYIFGKEGSGKDTPTWGEDEKGNRIVTGKFDSPDWSYVVSAGANSIYSHSGGFYPQTPTLKEAMDIVDEKYSKGKLIYENGGGVNESRSPKKWESTDNTDFDEKAYNREDRAKKELKVAVGLSDIDKAIKRYENENTEVANSVIKKLRDLKSKMEALILLYEDEEVEKKSVGGGVNNYTEAEKWWGNDLSLNEQKEYAKKHLQSFEYSELLGDTAQYSKRDRRQKFINEIWEKEGSPKSVLQGLYSNGGGIDSNWGNNGSTPSNNKDYNALYEMFPDNHTEAKAIWNQLSEKQKEGFLYDLRVTDAGSEHIEESWLEFINASSYEDWLDNATNWDEFKNGGGVPDGVHKVKALLKKEKIYSDDVSPNFVNDFAHKHGIKNLTSEQVVEISNTYDNGGGVDNYEESLNKMITKLNERISHYKERKNDLENNRIRPNKIIGTGFKPQYARKLAFEWLDEQILKDEKDLLFKKGLLESLKEGKNIILYNLEGKGVIREVEQEGYVTVYYINGMHSAYKRETLDRIKSEFNKEITPLNLPTRAETIEAIDGLRVMLDIEPDNNEYKQGIEKLKEYLDSLPKESFSDLNNPKNINGFIYKPTGDMINPNIYQDFQINYDSDNKIKSIELWGQENGIMYKLKNWNSDVIGSVFSGDNEVEMFEEGAEILVGGKADYLSLVDIAEMHKVSLDHILRQAKMGMKIEREHSNDTNKIVEIVKDHLVESPDYYTKLQKIESSFENGGGVEGYWIDVPSEHNNLFYLRTLANTRGINQGVLQESGLYRYTFTNERDMDTMIAELNKLQNPDFRRDMPQNLNQLKNYIEVGKLLRVSFNRNRPQAVGTIKVVVQTQTNGFYMKDGVRVPSDFNPNDFKNKSWIEYPKANLITFSPFGFTIYAPDIRDKSKLIKLLQYEYVVGEQLEIAMNTEQSDTFLYNNAIKMMEFVNKIYDLSDTVTFREGGKLTPEMFNNGLEYNFDKESVSCFITAKNTGRMLVLRRAGCDFNGDWSLISGGVDMGEVPDETIKREIQEELGVNLNYDTLNYLNATKHPDRTHHYFELAVNEEFEPVLNPENDAYMWINMSELPKNTHPLLIKYIKSDILV